MIDPNWWPLSSFAFGGMVNHPPARQRGSFADKTVGELFMTWLPVIVTGIIAPIVGFLVTEFKDIKKTEAAMAIELSTLKEHDRQLGASNEAQDRERRIEEVTVARRLDIHRSELDALRGRLDDHIARYHGR